jgi:bifunctional non-homologous end joining protein LigD
MRSLQTYRAKRDPARTPEPFATRQAGAAADAFVVQQHGARSLHWDLRLAIDGVLVSWAVPKGPSVDPREKRLAVQTEDHPLEYADFEGVIPAGNYGAGAMILWDCGAYRTYDRTPPGQALADGKLDLEIFGHKLRGRWALVRMKSASNRDWLFFKKADAFADGTDVILRYPASVVSGLTLAERLDPTAHSAEILDAVRAAGAAPAVLHVSDLKPMLAETGADGFVDDDWIFELKYDGVRAMLARFDDGRVLLRSRGGQDYAATFPEFALVGRNLPVGSMALDGEIIAVEDTGGGSFELLQKRLRGRNPSNVRVVMYAFDLLHLDGFDLRPLPLLRRKALLRALLPPVGPVRCADHVEANGVGLLDAARQRNLEGIVAKRARSPYRSGRRSGDWLKIKLPITAHLVIVGWQSGRVRRDVRSLLVAWVVDGSLRYAGNVAAALPADARDALAERLTDLEVARPAFDPGALAIPSGSRFVSPDLVAEVRYTEITARGALRQPVITGLVDVPWRDCAAPATAHTDAERPTEERAPSPADAVVEPTVPVTNEDKVFWPQEGYTKGDLLAYYERAWPFLRPYLRDRPLVLARYPDGIEGKNFYQQHAPPYVPAWVTTRRIDAVEFIICNDLRTLLYVVNLGCIPLHIWSARQNRPDHPDWVILDLDPKGAPWRDVIAIAQHIHRMLTALPLPHYVKTSGQSGLHILLPTTARMNHDQARSLAEILARVVAAEVPDIATTARALRARRGKVYVDYLQNGRGKTIAAPFCVRPKPGAPVSMPLRWNQVTARLDPQRYTISTVPGIIRRSADPLAAILSERVDAATIANALDRLQSRLLAAARRR